ncbi:MAG: GNAT family N-acetyltransferase, partial [Caulobacterales bacterium]
MIRPASYDDAEAIFDLHVRTSSISGGLARAPDEITLAQVELFLERALNGGAAFVALDGARLIGEVHCAPIGPRAFAHMLSDLTVAVDPDYQAKGIGASLFAELIAHVTVKMLHISRIE